MDGEMARSQSHGGCVMSELSDEKKLADDLLMSVLELREKVLKLEGSNARWKHACLTMQADRDKERAAKQLALIERDEARRIAEELSDSKVPPLPWESEGR